MEREVNYQNYVMHGEYSLGLHNELGIRILEPEKLVNEHLGEHNIGSLYPQGLNVVSSFGFPLLDLVMYLHMYHVKNILISVVVFEETNLAFLF